MIIKELRKKSLPFLLGEGFLGILLINELRLQESTNTLEQFNQHLPWLCSFSCLFLGISLIINVYLLKKMRKYEQKFREREPITKEIIAQCKKLEECNRNLDLLVNLGSLLQICFQVTETNKILQKILPEIFPGTSGGVFIFNEAKTNLIAIACWGDYFYAQTILSPCDCICLRQGSIHLIEEEQPEISCQYWTELHKGTYLCIPLIALGAIIGILALNYEQQTRLTAEQKELAMATSKQIALGIGNIQLREKLREESIHDELTGLYNRRYLKESLERELCRVKRTGQSLSVIMLDVDHFKYFNDTFGHDAGDAILQELGNYLKNHIRGEDIPCRYGGEEFAVVLLGASLEDTVKRAEQIRDEIKALRVHRGKQSLYSVSVSIGIACFPQHGETVAKLIETADIAMYQAKAEGRDRVVLAKL